MIAHILKHICKVNAKHFWISEVINGESIQARLPVWLCFTETQQYLHNHKPITDKKKKIEKGKIDGVGGNRLLFY